MDKFCFMFVFFIWILGQSSVSGDDSVETVNYTLYQLGEGDLESDNDTVHQLGEDGLEAVIDTVHHRNDDGAEPFNDTAHRLRQDDLEPVNETIHQLSEDDIDTPMKLPPLEVRFTEELALVEQRLEAKIVNTILPKYIDSKIQESLSGVLNGSGAEDMITGTVIKQLERMREKFKNMKRRVRSMASRMKKMETERDMMKKTTSEVLHVIEEMGNFDPMKLINDELNTTQEVLRDMVTVGQEWMNEVLKRNQLVLQNNANIKLDTFNMKRDLNNTSEILGTLMNENARYQKQLQQMRDDHQNMTTRLNNFMADLKTTRQGQEENTIDLSRINILLNQTTKDVQMCGCPKIPVTTTTMAPVIVHRDMNLLFGPVYPRSNFHLLPLNRKRSTVFHLQLQFVSSVIYISSVNVLLISAQDNYPKSSLMTYSIDTKVLQTIQEGVQSNGLCLDEELQTVFLTTIKPNYYIYKIMVGEWKMKRMVTTYQFGLPPWRIAVDPKQRMIYACVMNALLRVDYDGRKMDQLYTGEGMYTVALDLSKGHLYFNNAGKLTRRSLHSNSTAEMLRLRENPNDMVYYNNTIYVLYSSNAIVNEIKLNQELHDMREKQMPSVSGSSRAMCLVPPSVRRPKP